MKCVQRCDGILRDLGGYPIDPILRKRYTLAKLMIRKAKTQLNNIDRDSSFYELREWKELRYKAFKVYGRKCNLCKAENRELHVDHIKPRSKFPDLELKLSNLQILCRDCNLGKSNLDETDWRIK